MRNGRHSGPFAASIVALALALLTSCGGSSAPAPSSSGPESPASSSAAPVRHVLTIYLCASLSPTPCTRPVTAGRTAAIRQRLQADADIVSTRYRSQMQQYRAAKKRLGPKVTKLMRPGDVPAAFIIDVRSAARVAAVEARYRHVPGVFVVQPCKSGC